MKMYILVYVCQRVTIMKYVLSGTFALALQNDLPFIPLHYSFIAFTSTPQFIPL
jgi:hypothetical protein